MAPTYRNEDLEKYAGGPLTGQPAPPIPAPAGRNPNYEYRTIPGMLISGQMPNLPAMPNLLSGVLPLGGRAAKTSTPMSGNQSPNKYGVTGGVFGSQPLDGSQAPTGFPSKPYWNVSGGPGMTAPNPYEKPYWFNEAPASAMPQGAKGGNKTIKDFSKGHMFTNQDLFDLYGDGSNIESSNFHRGFPTTVPGAFSGQVGPNASVNQPWAMRTDTPEAQAGGMGGSPTGIFDQLQATMRGAPGATGSIPTSGKSSMPWDNPELTGNTGALGELMNRYKELQGVMGKRMLRGTKQAYMNEMDMLGKLIPAYLDETGWKQQFGMGELGQRERKLQSDLATADMERSFYPGKALADIQKSLFSGESDKSTAELNRYKMSQPYWDQMGTLAGIKSSKTAPNQKLMEIRYNALQSRLTNMLKSPTPGMEKERALIEAELKEIEENMSGGAGQSNFDSSFIDEALQ